MRKEYRLSKLAAPCHLVKYSLTPIIENRILVPY